MDHRLKHKIHNKKTPEKNLGENLHDFRVQKCIGWNMESTNNQIKTEKKIEDTSQRYMNGQ